MQGNKLFVMLGYGDSYNLGISSLSFRTNEMIANEACEVVKMVDEYNEFNGKRVSEVIKEIGKLWQSNYQQVGFLFGRESSPVLYVVFPFWKSQAERFENRDELIKKSLDLLKTALPDELNEDIHGYRARAWWD